MCAVSNHMGHTSNQTEGRKTYRSFSRRTVESTLRQAFTPAEYVLLEGIERSRPRPSARHSKTLESERAVNLSQSDSELASTRPREWTQFTDALEPESKRDPMGSGHKTQAKVRKPHRLKPGRSQAGQSLQPILTRLTNSPVGPGDGQNQPLNMPVEQMRQEDGKPWSRWIKRVFK